MTKPERRRRKEGQFHESRRRRQRENLDFKNINNNGMKTNNSEKIKLVREKREALKHRGTQGPQTN